MGQPERHALYLLKRTPELPGHHNRAVAATGATDGNSEVAFALGDVLRQREAQKTRQTLDEILGGRVLPHVAHHRRVKPGERTQAVDEVRVRQAPDIEEQVRIDRDPPLVAETQEVDHHPGSGPAVA